MLELTVAIPQNASDDSPKKSTFLSKHSVATRTAIVKSGLKAPRPTEKRPTLVRASEREIGLSPKPFEIRRTRVPLGNPGQDERDSGMIPNGVPG